MTACVGKGSPHLPLPDRDVPLPRIEHSEPTTLTALYRIVLTRMSSHEVMRCLKRCVARQVFKHLPRTT